MEQLVQKLKNGNMAVVDLPFPALKPGHVIVRNHFSLISAGTEGSTVQAARKGFLGKAKDRPQQVRQVLETLKSQGPVQTYRAVMSKLDAYSPLGYSSAGSVIDVAGDVADFAPGDLVACGGLSASHAEIVSVPVNLCVKLHPESDLRQAAYNTLGAIAMQGIRQADLRLGETCAVIGLGLLGQLTSLLLRASGVRVVGIDIDPGMVDISRKNCADLAYLRSSHGVESGIFEFTKGLGCDAVIITAAAASLDPINLAGALARKKGTIVVVGAVPTGFDRDPHFYRKELQVRMSCSYGPGRYDPQYEEKGVDYPAAYVRWTEKRNMEAFQEMIHSGRVDVRYLTTHVFKLEAAPDAYDMMMSKSEPYIGILIEYEKDRIEAPPRISLTPKMSRGGPSAVCIGFIGAGSYARNQLLPNIPRNRTVSLKGIMTATGATSRSVGERFGFDFCTSDAKGILENEEIDTVFIATRHDSHAEYVMKAIAAGKHTFVEKPLCLTEEELNGVRETYEQASDRGKAGKFMVGYNRRFSPLSEFIRSELNCDPKAMIYRINAGAILPDSWIQDRDTGGGRIVGEVCHFVDLLGYFAGSRPVAVYASVMRTASNMNDTVHIQLRYENGSIGTIGYFANGDKSVPKERVEIYAGGCIGVIEDFRSASIHARGKRKDRKLLSQDKGQRNEIRSFLDAVSGSGEAPIPFDELCLTSQVTFKVLESLRTGCAVRL